MCGCLCMYVCTMYNVCMHLCICSKMYISINYVDIKHVSFDNAMYCAFERVYMERAQYQMAISLLLVSYYYHYVCSSDCIYSVYNHTRYKHFKAINQK